MFTLIFFTYDIQHLDIILVFICIQLFLHTSNERTLMEV